MGNVTDEALLVQLGYTQSHGMMEPLKRIIKNTHGYESIKKHIVSLQEALKPYGSFIAISSSHNFFKIKNENKSEVAYELIHKWSEKYKVNLTKVSGKEAYYIEGQRVVA
jgi:hypothetical protein